MLETQIWLLEAPLVGSTVLVVRSTVVEAPLLLGAPFWLLEAQFLVARSTVLVASSTVLDVRSTVLVVRITV